MSLVRGEMQGCAVTPKFRNNVYPAIGREFTVSQNLTRHQQTCVDHLRTIVPSIHDFAQLEPPLSASRYSLPKPPIQ